jgi:type IV secretion system protein VirD4
MSRALAFMADPDLAASVLPAPGTGFDIDAFLYDCGTVYLIAEAVSEDAPVAPLFAAMAAEIHYTAAQTGQATPGGRLDPPLLMALDEITQTCPVPLPSWLADSAKEYKLPPSCTAKRSSPDGGATTAARSSWTPAR